MNAQFHFKQRTLKLALVSALALGSATMSGYSFAANDATATATGTVIAPISVTKASDLSFGKFAPGAGGTVTVSTSGSRTVNGVIASSVGSTPTAAKFDVTGDAAATYTISYTGTSTTLTTGAAGINETMALTPYSDLTGLTATTTTVGSGTLNGSGAQSIYVGGQLAVAQAQAPGAYTGNIVVTVQYN